MGTDGMRSSLPSRDLIADSIECVMRGQLYDANISLVYPFGIQLTVAWM
jgi:dihydroxy-acid dehydratase